MEVIFPKVLHNRELLLTFEREFRRKRREYIRDALETGVNDTVDENSPRRAVESLITHQRRFRSS